MAGALIGALRVVLSTDTAAFSNGLKKAEGDLAAFQKRANAIGKTVGVALGSAVVALGAITKASAKLGSEIDDAAQRVGISAESFQELAYAAKLAGVEMPELEKSLLQMTKRLGEVKVGNTQAADSLAKLGLSLKQVQGLKPDEAFKLLADRISQVPNKMQQASLATEFFGKAGAQMLPVLAGGSAGLAKMADEARRLGLILSNETIKQAAAADDEFDRIGLALKVAGVNLTAGFLPALEQIRKIVTSQEFQQGIKDFGENMGRAVQFLVDNKEAIRDVSFAFAGMVVGGRVAGAFGAVAGAAAGLAYSTATAGQSIQNLNGQIKILEAELARLLQKQSTPNDIGRVIIQDPETLKQNIEEVEFQLSKLRLERDKILAGPPSAALRVGKGGGIDPAMLAAARAVQEEIQQIQFKTQIANKEFRNFAEGFPEAAAKLKLFGQSGIETRTTIESLPPALRALNEQLLILEGSKLTQEHLAPWDEYALKLERIEMLQAKRIITEETAARASRKAAEQTGQAWDLAASSITGNFAAAFKDFAASNKSMGGLAKAFAITQAIINTYTAASKAWALYGPTPFGYAAVAAALAVGFGQVANIRAQKFATGGSFTIPGGTGGSDSKLVPIMGFPGERVTVERPDQQRSGAGEWREITIRVDEISRATVEKLIPALNQALGDGHRLKVA